MRPHAPRYPFGWRRPQRGFDGGLKPLASTFGADQLEEDDEADGAADEEATGAADAGEGEGEGEGEGGHGELKVRSQLVSVIHLPSRILDNCF